MATPELTEVFSDVIRKWRSADSQRAIFGIHMPQAQKAIDELCESLQKVFTITPSFYLVKKDQAMEIIVPSGTLDAGASPASSIPAALPSMPKIFNQLKMDSLAIHQGITRSEIGALFTGLSMTFNELEGQGGLNGFLQKQGAVHIHVDQVKFQLLKDGDQITSERETAGAAENSQKSGKSDKERDAAWKEYIEGILGKDDFERQHKDLIEAAIKDPKQIEKLFKRILAKQKEVERFVVHLEQKLFDLGFTEKAVSDLKKKLIKPKKVLIAEDELARLRKIEKEFQKNDGQQIDVTLETIERIKKKLSEETERSEAMMHQLGEGGMILDREGKILSVNATAQKVLGLQNPDVLGKTVKEILRPHHTLTAVSNWQNESDTHTPKEIKVQALNDETLAIIRESAIVIENETGRAIGVLSALQNVTQQDELNRRKTDILDVLGHDLRAPLNAIKQNFDVIVMSSKLDTEGTDQQKRFLGNCRNSIDRMSRLIEKILDMRQLETGKILLKYDTVDPGILLDQAVRSLTEWAQNKKIGLNVKAESLPRITVDPERIYQVITNLVSNGLKFTPEGGTITATGKLVQWDESEFVEIAVKDTGMGIDPKNLLRIFDKYEQVTVNAPAGVRGLGLGLSICKAIIEMHRGRVWAESELGKGSTFIFQVPVEPKNDTVLETVQNK